MPRLFAFLRAMNVGGRNLPMAELRRLFEEMGVAKVETFIASGNVVFESPLAEAKLVAKIEKQLARALGYEVHTFVRDEAELAAIARAQPFTPPEVAAAQALNVAFLAAPPDGAQAEQVRGLETEIDRFEIAGREIYWLCRVKQSESKFSNQVLERTLKVRATLRGIGTIRKLAARYLPSS